MADYTIEMFREDNVQTGAMLKFLDAVQLPEEEWPKFEVNGRICAINPNFQEADLAGYFISKYGKVNGTDFVARFLRIKWFIHEHLDDLKRKKLLRGNERGQNVIKEELLKVILESFNPPQPGSLFPDSSLMGESGNLDYKRVIKALDSFQKNK